MIYKKNMGTRLPLRTIIYSIRLLDYITLTTCTTEKRLIMYIRTNKDIYQCFEINNAALVESKYNTSGAFIRTDF